MSGGPPRPGLEAKPVTVHGKKRVYKSTRWVLPAGAQMARLAAAKKHGEHSASAPQEHHEATSGHGGATGAATVHPPQHPTAQPVKEHAFPKAHPVEPKPMHYKPGSKEDKAQQAHAAWVQEKAEEKAAHEKAELKKLPLAEQTKRLADAKAARVWTDEHPTGMPKETIDKYHTTELKVKDPQRALLHAGIKEHFLDKVKPVAPGEQKIAIMTMGAPSSGKSSALGATNLKKFVEIDPDQIKDHLPEFRKATDPKKTFRGAAAMVHEESSALGKEIMKDAIAQGKHVLVDGTGHDAGNYIKKMDALKAAGYEINVRMPDLPVDVGLARMKVRAEKKGRYVPDEKVVDAYEKIPRNVNKIMAKADTFQMVDNGPNPARLVLEKKKDGTIVIHDKAYMEAFYKRNPQNT